MGVVGGRNGGIDRCYVVRIEGIGRVHFCAAKRTDFGCQLIGLMAPIGKSNGDRSIESNHPALQNP
jgi:hypothetical protein